VDSPVSTLDDLRWLIEQLKPKAWERTILCSREQEEFIASALDKPEFTGVFRIITSPHLEPGKVYVIDDKAMEKLRDQPFRYEVQWPES
jgi:hypothetical protein